MSGGNVIPVGRYELEELVRPIVATMLTEGTNVTLTTTGSGATTEVEIAASGGGGGGGTSTGLTYAISANLTLFGG